MSPETQSKGYVFIMADRGNNMIAMDVTADLKKKMAGYKKITQSIKLVYYKPFAKHHHAVKRLAELSSLPKKQKFELITRHNPDWHDLTKELGA